MVMRLSSIFGSEIRFMCGHILHGRVKFGVRRLGRDIGRHRAFRNKNNAGRFAVLNPLDHAAGRAGIVGSLYHIRRAFGVRQDFDARLGLAVAAEFLAR